MLHATTAWCEQAANQAADRHRQSSRWNGVAVDGQTMRQTDLLAFDRNQFNYERNFFVLVAIVVVIFVVAVAVSVRDSGCYGCRIVET